MANYRLIFLFFCVYVLIPYNIHAEITGDLGTSSLSRRDFITSFAQEGHLYFNNIEYISGEHAVVWYNPAGSSNPVELFQYAQRTVDIADSVLATYYDSGYDVAPGDSLLSHAFTNGQYYYGINNLIDIYLTDLSSQRLLGLVQADSEISFINEFGVIQSSAFMLLDNSYALLSSENLHRITVAHELFHIIQNGYRMFTSNDVFSDYHALLEITAVAKEQFIYPNIKNYAVGAKGYLENGFLEPLPSKAPRNRRRYDIVDLYYGASLWVVQLLNQTQSAEVLVDIFKRIKKGDNTALAIENAFIANDIEFDLFWDGFINQVINLKFDSSSLVDAEMLAIPIIRDTLEANGSFLVESKNFSTSVIFNKGQVSTTIESQSDNSWVLKNIYNTDIWYVYNRSLSSEKHLANLSNMQYNQQEDYFVYPNPILLNTHRNINLSYESHQDLLKYSIYNISGKKVKKGTVFQDKIDISQLESSGVYFIVMKKRDKKLIFRFVAIK